MSVVTEDEKKRLWDEVREEFPDDEMMQEVHYVCLLHHWQMKDLSLEERIKFYNDRGMASVPE